MMTAVKATRLSGNPIVRPDMDELMGSNVQGPSLIRVPDWVENPLGRYYLYFADHKGSYIRLAYADALEGPWQIHSSGSLHLEDSHFLTVPAAIPSEVDPDSREWSRPPGQGVPTPLDSATKPHIASPDVHARDDRREIIMYYHGLEGFRSQRTRAATSTDGINFTAADPLIGDSTYLRAFEHDDQWHAMAMPGVFYRSPDGIPGAEDPGFERGPKLFPDTMRHSALLKRGDTLFVFWSNVGDEPEHILVSTVDVRGDWSRWVASEPRSVLLPEQEWEGADLPLAPSIRDAINVRARQLRDPAIFEEDDRTYLLYAVAGESGIAIAELSGIGIGPD